MRKIRREVTRKLAEAAVLAAKEISSPKWQATGLRRFRYAEVAGRDLMDVSSR